MGRLSRLGAVEVRELAVAGAIEVTPRIHRDERGAFTEWYRFEALEAHLGHRLDLRQANLSVSRAGTVRGIHYADVPPGQAKHVTCVRGAVIDYVVDLRVGSPTFGVWDSVRLDDVERRAVYLSEGLGHCFVALEDDSTVTYLVSEVYNPSAEHGIDPLDPEVGLAFPEGLELLLSHKDTEAPSLADALAAGALPRLADVEAHLASRRAHSSMNAGGGSAMTATNAGGTHR